MEWYSHEEKLKFSMLYVMDKIKKHKLMKALSRMNLDLIMKSGYWNLDVGKGVKAGGGGRVWPLANYRMNSYTTITP